MHFPSTACGDPAPVGTAVRRERVELWRARDAGGVAAVLCLAAAFVGCTAPRPSPAAAAAIAAANAARDAQRAQLQSQLRAMMGQGVAPSPVAPDAVQVVLQTGHTGAITAVAMSSDGRLVASGGIDGAVKLWDLASGQEVRSLTGQGGVLWPTAISFAPGGRRVLIVSAHGVSVQGLGANDASEVFEGAVASADGTRIVVRKKNAGDGLTVLDAANSRQVATLAVPSDANPTVLSADGRWLVTSTPDVGDVRAAMRAWASGSATDAATGWPASQPTVIETWDLRTKASVGHCRTSVSPAGLRALSPDGQTLAIEIGERKIMLLDTAHCATGRVLESGFALGDGYPTLLAFSPDGRSLAYATSHDRCRQWLLPDGRLDAPLEASALGWRADGTQLVIGHGSGGAPLVRSSSDGAETRLSAGAVEVSDVIVAKGGRAVVAAMRDGTAKWWEVASAELIATYDCPGHGAATSVALNRAESLLALGCEDGSASLWDTRSGARRALLLAPGSGAPGPVLVRFLNGAPIVVAARSNELIAWDVEGFGELRRMPMPAAPVPKQAGAASRIDWQWIRSMAVHPSAPLVAVGQPTLLTLWNVASGELIRPLYFKPPPDPLQMAMTNPALQRLLGQKPPADSAKAGAAQGAPGAPSGKPTADSGAYDIAFSPDGLRLLSVGEHGPHLSDVNSGAELAIASTHNPASMPADAAAEYMQSMLGGALEGVSSIRGKAQDRAAKGLGFSPDGRIAARGLGGAVKLWDVASGRELAALAGHASDVTAVAFSDDGRTLVSGGRDGAIRIWSTASGRETVALIALGARDFVAVTPDQYYRASKSELKGIAFRWHDGVYPFEQFDLRYNRPDIILERIGRAPPDAVQAYRHAYQRRLTKMGFRDDTLGSDFHLPELQVLSGEPPLSTPAGELSVRVRARDSQYPLDRFQAYVNDVPVFGAAGLPIADRAQSAETQIRVPLVAGRNKIQFSVLNAAGVESLRNTAYTTSTAVSAPRETWIVAIGVSRYQNSHYDLRFAAKDASDITALFSGSTQGVHVLTLTDENATSARIHEARQWLAAAHPQDLVVVFASGHGLTDADSNYFFGTYDIDADRPAEHGLPFEDLEALLDGIAPLQKLLLVDTCFSGEIDRDAPAEIGRVDGAGELTMRAFRPLRGVHTAGDTDAAVGPAALPAYASFQQDLFADLRRGTGAAVISSASGNEYALEGDQWHNGVFTYVVLDGLKHGKADRNGDGVVTVSELEAYTIDAVGALTHGKQHPTVRRENLDYDFPVY